MFQMSPVSFRLLQIQSGSLLLNLRRILRRSRVFLRQLHPEILLHLFDGCLKLFGIVKLLRLRIDLFRLQFLYCCLLKLRISALNFGFLSPRFRIDMFRSMGESELVQRDIHMVRVMAAADNIRPVYDTLGKVLCGRTDFRKLRQNIHILVETVLSVFVPAQGFLALCIIFDFREDFLQLLFIALLIAGCDLAKVHTL